MSKLEAYADALLKVAGARAAVAVHFEVDENERIVSTLEVVEADSRLFAAEGEAIECCKAVMRGEE